MVSHKISKPFGIISHIRTLDIKSKKLIYYRLIHPYLTSVSMSGPLPIELILKPHEQTAQKKSVRTLFATAQQLHAEQLMRDIFINQKILPLDKLINQQVKEFLLTG